MQRIPKLAGLKNEVIIPKHSRNVYDHAVRMPGVDIIEVNTREELETAINPRTAMIMIMSVAAADERAAEHARTSARWRKRGTCR